MNLNTKEKIKYSKATVPTKYGLFTFYCFIQNNKENIAMVYGDIKNKENVLVRIHSECFTGDVLQSLKCDCGEQLDKALKKITEKKAGVVIYLKQEGRGIGLFEKLNAYHLQENENLDTIESNLALGHEIDSRSYEDAIEIITFFNIKSIDLITNNPLKVNELKKENITVANIISLSSKMNPYNESYLTIKKTKLNHSIDITQPNTEKEIQITASYAQSVNGTISMDNLEPIQLSNKDSLNLTHKLRASHDAILVGINTVLSDNPKLTLRHVKGKQPQPCILDTDLKCDVKKDVFKHPLKPWFFTASNNDKKIKELTDLGCKIFKINKTTKNILSLPEIISILKKENIKAVIVEGGKRILTQFLNEGLINHCIITISPLFISGTNVLDKDTSFKLTKHIQLKGLNMYTLADNIIIEGTPSHV
ncbi:MAG: GTP cyclohydrolase II [Rickettsiales bacterium]|nr:GTP cyclohydrolase II [Rickettsiales bacterium]|tara:strand:- start:3398 stop:4663 length:1266 start_codon:yes stop_codon:yes gene_type:complete